MKKLINAFAGIIVVSFILTGCLKDKKFDDHVYGIKDPAGSPDGVLLPEGGTKLVARAVDLVTTSQSTRMFEVSLASEAAARQDIHVNIASDSNLVKAYNTANSTTMTIMNPSLYNFPSKLTIRAGKMVDTFKLTLPNASLLNPNLSYGFAFTITSVDEAGYTIAANLKTIYIQLSVKNKYDGRYKVTGNFVDVNLPLATSVYPYEVDIITSGPNSVTFYKVVNGVSQPAYNFLNNGGGTFYGNWGPIFTFDLATNKLTTVTNYFGQGTNTSSRSGGIDATGTNQFDPVTHNFTAKYFMYQPFPTIRAKFDETYTYVRAR